MKYLTCPLVIRLIYCTIVTQSSISCSTERHLRITEVDNVGSPSDNEVGVFEYSIYVPKGFKKYSFESESKRVFLVYPDSSVIFVLTDEYSYANFFLFRLEMPLNPRVRSEEHAEYEGVQNGKWWTERLLGNAIVGYANVPQSSKVKFDRAITSFNSKRRK